MGKQATYKLKSILSKILIENALQEEQLNSMVHHCFETIKEVCYLYYQKGYVNPLCHLFLQSCSQGDAKRLILDIEISLSGKISAYLNLPTLLGRKAISELVSAELDEIKIYFSCRSMSKLLRYFSLGGNFIANEYIRKNTIKRFMCDRSKLDNQLDIPF